MKTKDMATVSGTRLGRRGDGAEMAIEVREVSKSYSRRRGLGLRSRETVVTTALRDVSLAVRAGEMVGLLGPNGAGKTTLLKSVAGLLEVSSGRILVHGRDVNLDPVGVRRLMGLVTCDERSFYWRLSGRRNLRFFAALYGLVGTRLNERVEVLLETLGLTEAADRPFQTYSTGMRQKLAIARGLLAEPRLVLYDEPTRSLDPVSAQNIRAWIRASRATSPSTTHLIATNQLREAEQLCDRVVILNRGAVIAEGAIEQIRTRVRVSGRIVHRVTCRGFDPNGSFGPQPELGLLEVAREAAEGNATTLRLVTSDEGDGLSAALAEILRKGGSVLRCETEQVPFDEVFCALVANDLIGTGEGAP